MKMKKMKKLLFLASVFLSGIVGAQNSNLWISITDQIAGSSLPVNISGFTSNENFNVKISRPDGTNLDFVKVADQNGKASFEILGLHLQKAGDYSLEISRQDFGTNFQDFKVFPGSVSAYRSEFSILDPSIAADGEAEARFSIKLKDAFGNSLVNKAIQIFSSRDEDFIVATKISDKYGSITGKISSSVAGVSKIAAVCEGVLLFQKPEIVFFLSNPEIKNVGASGSLGDMLKIQLFEDPTVPEVTYFLIENLPLESAPNENLTVKVSARDERGEVIEGYLGTIRFSSSDDRAQLPVDYRFTNDDQGSHIFYLSTTFGTSGTQTLAVRDLNNSKISGEKIIQIKSTGIDLPVEDEKPKIEILTPTAGIIRTARITISGNVVGCSSIKLIDGPTILIDDLKIDETGNFAYQTPRLADGKHEIKGICNSDGNIFSQIVSLQIDRTPPAAMSVEVSPTGYLEKSQSFEIKIGASETISQAKCVFNDILINLTSGTNNTFTGPTITPNECGEFLLNCTISDLLGNELEEPNAAIIKVCNPNAVAPETEKIAPTVISNLYTKNEKDRVVLNWSPAISNNKIANYRINFGKCGETLSGVNVTPDDRTQWYVNEIKECEKTCFAVTAIDENGLEGVISPEVEGEIVCADMHPASGEAPKTGSGKPWLSFSIAILAGMGVFVFIRRRV
jgi:LPXTG-motif cell wall-anchored protein